MLLEFALLKALNAGVRFEARWKFSKIIYQCIGKDSIKGS